MGKQSFGQFRYMQYHEYALFQFCKYIIIWYNYNGKKKRK